MLDSLIDLIAIGFTGYEAKVYLALLASYPASGYQLSKQAGIPRSMVYEALGRLHTRGAVLKTNEQRSTLYRPVPPDMLISRYEQEQARHVERLRQGLEHLYAAHQEDHLWSVSGRNSVLSYAEQMLGEASQEVLLVLADPPLEALRAAIEAACQRGVEVSSLLTGAGQLDCGNIARHPPVESELQELTTTLLVVSDSQKCLIANTEPDASATITTNRNLVLVARQFVWMEFFAQRLYHRLGPDLLERLDPQDQRIFENFANPIPQ